MKLEHLLSEIIFNECEILDDDIVRVDTHIESEYYSYKVSLKELVCNMKEFIKEYEN